MDDHSSRKRRIKAAPETIREQSKKTSETDNKSKRSSGRIKKFLRPVFHPIYVVLSWIARHFIPRYFRDSFKELRLVTWSPRKQNRQLTYAVIIFSIVFAFLVSLADLGLGKVFKRLFLKG